MLTLMPQRVQGAVIDIGCGSGVLSIAAKLSGASDVMGIDIDEEAIAHAKRNSALNNLNCFFGKTLPHVPTSPLILMNMISSEQSIAWNSLPKFPGATLIVSGYPLEEEDPTHYGTLLNKLELDGWKGFKILLSDGDKDLQG
jgi:ribosomal protein L11 methyltransferase